MAHKYPSFMKRQKSFFQLSLSERPKNEKVILGIDHLLDLETLPWKKYLKNGQMLVSKILVSKITQVLGKLFACLETGTDVKN